MGDIVGCHVSRYSSGVVVETVLSIHSPSQGNVMEEYARRVDEVLFAFPTAVFLYWVHNQSTSKAPTVIRTTNICKGCKPGPVTLSTMGGGGTSPPNIPLGNFQHL